MTRLLIPLHEAPGVIRESTRTAITAHGYLVCDHQGRPISAQQLEALFNEFGRNAAQALVSIDESERFDIEVSDETLDAIDGDFDRKEAEGL